MFYTAPCLTLPKTRSTTRSCYTGVDLANRRGRTCREWIQRSTLFLCALCWAWKNFTTKTALVAIYRILNFNWSSLDFYICGVGPYDLLLLIYCSAVLSASGVGQYWTWASCRREGEGAGPISPILDLALMPRVNSKPLCLTFNRA